MTRTCLDATFWKPGRARGVLSLGGAIECAVPVRLRSQRGAAPSSPSGRRAWGLRCGTVPGRLDPGPGRQHAGDHRSDPHSVVRPPRPAYSPPSPAGRTGCGRGRRRGRPRRAARSWRPRSTMRPSSTTRIRSASRTVDSRCAMTSDVRPVERGRQRALHRGLGLGVEVRGRLVEHDDVGRLEQQPGDRQPLLLAAGQPVAAVADDGVEAVGQRRDQVPDLRGPQRLDQLVLGGLRAGRRAGWRGSCRGTCARPG